MSHRKPTKTKFIDLWRDDAQCAFIVALDETMRTAWDNIDVGTWKKSVTVEDPKADVAKFVCFECPVREACLRDAIRDNEAEGMRAGFRFENGAVDKLDSRKIFNEFGMRARVSKKSQKVSGEVDVESEDMSGVSESE